MATRRLHSMGYEVLQHLNRLKTMLKQFSATDERLFKSLDPLVTLSFMVCLVT
ncbi:protein of unknown function [Legionella fallonii LLAP-10]|uniref:Uncharacterized protein n=1 Tax=Legionella fallonii LLAP-10 TaxID=1212491 RepID=A0A098G1P7_9GAMM|nr:protein of unknown function [Legionella fallonii LLAP-10]